MPFLTSWFHPLSTATEEFPSGYRGKQTQGKTTSHEVAAGTFDLATESESQGHTPPQFTSRVPVYDHVLPNQRAIPRIQPALPPRQRRLFTTDRNDANKDIAVKENVDLQETTWQSGDSGQFGDIDDLTSDTGIVSRYGDHPCDSTGSNGGDEKTGDSVL